MATGAVMTMCILLFLYQSWTAPDRFYGPGRKLIQGHMAFESGIVYNRPLLAKSLGGSRMHGVIVLIATGLETCCPLECFAGLRR